MRARHTIGDTVYHKVLVNRGAGVIIGRTTAWIQTCRGYKCVPAFTVKWENGATTTERPGGLLKHPNKRKLAAYKAIIARR